MRSYSAPTAGIRLMPVHRFWGPTLDENGHYSSSGGAMSGRPERQFDIRISAAALRFGTLDPVPFVSPIPSRAGEQRALPLDGSCVDGAGSSLYDPSCIG